LQFLCFSDRLADGYPRLRHIIVCMVTLRIFAFAFPCKRCKEKQLMALIQTLKRHALLTYFVLAYVLT
jgi:hypothetical protein